MQNIQKQVLWLDKDRTYLEQMAIALASESGRIDFFCQLGAAIFRIMQNHYEVVLLDFDLIGLNGLDVVAALRKEGWHGVSWITVSNILRVNNVLARELGVARILEKSKCQPEVACLLKNLSGSASSEP